MNLKGHKYTCSLSTEEHLEVPFFLTDVLQRLHPKATFGEILESSPVLSHISAGPHLYFLPFLKGYICFLVCSMLSLSKEITQEDCVFHWGHVESDAVDVVDDAVDVVDVVLESSRLPAPWLFWIYSLTWQSVSTWPTYTAQELLCEPYLMYTFGILQPGTIHFLHIVRTSPTKKWLSSYRCRIAPNLLKRPNCCWFVLWKCLNSLGGR